MRVVRRAVIAQDRARLVAQPLAQGEDDARLADAGLAGQEHDLALALLGLPPAIEQQRELLLAADERREAPQRAGPRSAPRRGPARGMKRPHRPGEAPRGQGRVLDLEQPAEQPPRALGDDDLPGSASACRRAARFGVSPTTASSWAAPSPIRSPTTTSPVAMPTRAASGSPAGVASRATASTIASPARTARSASSSCASGPAEVGQHAVAHELGDVALEAGDLARDRVLVRAEDLAHLLRVEPGGERGRADEVDEHHRELPALRAS